MPAHHDVRPKDVFARRLHATLAAAAEQGPVDFADLLLSPGVGARTVQSLAMVAEVLHGAPFPFRDPARFSLAHGGKDRHRDTDIPVCARRETKETPMGQGWYGCATWEKRHEESLVQSNSRRYPHVRNIVLGVYFLEPARSPPPSVVSTACISAMSRCDLQYSSTLSAIRCTA